MVSRSSIIALVTIVLLAGIVISRAESRSLPACSPGHSVGESNAWSTALLQAARSALPNSEHQETWRQTAILYSLNAICLPEDRTSERIVAGQPLKNRVMGANFEPGGILEYSPFALFFMPGVSRCQSERQMPFAQQ